MSNPSGHVERVLVVGGTGLLGRCVVAALQSVGVEVAVLSRGIRPTTGLYDVEQFVGDVRKGEGLSEAMRDADVVVHCIQPVDTVIDTALRLDRPHIVYVSIVGVDQIPISLYRTKYTDERHLEASGLPWSVLRATQFHDLVTVLLRALSASRILLLPKGFRIQPVDVAEVGTRLASLAVGAPTRRVDEFGGPEVRTIRSLAEAYLDQTGRRRRIVEAPLPLPGAAARALRQGQNLTPEHADGQIAFDEYLRRLVAAGERPYAGVLGAYASPRRLLRTHRPS